MGTKMAVAFGNIFMAKIEKEILRQSSIKPMFWKRFIDDVISVWDTSPGGYSRKFWIGVCREGS